ncbi:MAG: hypothetical protein A2015_05765 [Spirochaetes bacterium GWF1_31_7]|nr:MAG: hypothetical protein A2Y30_00175 [Spirochaetes bacterium GWE1_32_154]OHD47197.1 MAG: hypothetical protein A2Y29_10760 [Spirochaetes bacterium GWE2_31_10]OHD48930.1 MAG: hypothetical protein A2015_05765 [Spirochaetes bacterium GWF1_31_7]OHD81840.1 MAG: hypothetical protein A2355_13940 [Spirochaetes bacterium RIFOXYB1_FULL_32_8]HBD92595.1 hypothetical protein [Spirochaetia bacterium]
MKKLLIAFFCVNFSFSLLANHSVTLLDGTILTNTTITYSDNSLLLKEKQIPRETISHIMMNIPDSTAISSVSLLQVDHNELLMRAKVLEEKYPDSAKLILLDEGIEKLNTDGTNVIRTRYAVKIMNESALDLAQISLYISSGKVESKLIFARCINPDGSIHYLNMNDFTWTTPSRGAEFYGNDKEIKIGRAVIPGVKTGSIVDYEYERTESSKEDPNQFYTQWFFNNDSPVYQSNFQIIVPVTKEFYIHKKNIDTDKLTESITKSDGFTIYSYSYTESSPVTTESQGPLHEDLLSSIYGSTFKDQSYLSKWLSQFFTERMMANESITKTVSEVTKNLSTEEEKIAALYYFMQNNIRYLSIKTSLSSGLAGHKASETFNNRYGDCIDKSILFATMLRSINIDAYPVIVMTNDNSQPLYGLIGTLDGNHAINEIHLKTGKVIYLDSTGNSYRYPFFRTDDHGIHAWNPLKNTIRNTGYPKPVDNSITTQIDITIDKNGTGKVTETTTTHGSEEVRFREYFKMAKKEQVLSTMQYFANKNYTGSTLTNHSFNDPTDMSADYSFSLEYINPMILNKAGNNYLLNIKQDFGFNFITPDERKTPVIFPTVLQKTYRGTITLPDNFTISGLPAPLQIQSKHVNYTGTYTITGNMITYENIYSRSGTHISVAEYDEFREILIKIDDYIKKPIIFDKKN